MIHAVFKTDHETTAGVEVAVDWLGDRRPLWKHPVDAVRASRQAFGLTVDEAVVAVSDLRSGPT